MYKKILPLVNRFIYLRQGYFNRFYEGKILEITPDTLTLQAYDEQGRLDSQWVIALPTITEFMTGDRDLDELNMKVSMAKTIEQAELTELEQLTLAGLQPSSCQLVGSLPPTLFSSTGSFSEAASGMSSSSSQLKKTPETGESLPKTPTLYGHLSETLRSTASYLEETLGFSTPSSSAVTPSLEDEQQPQA